jgi:hypothetical protein
MMLPKIWLPDGVLDDGIDFDDQERKAPREERKPAAVVRSGAGRRHAKKRLRRTDRRTYEQNTPVV